MSFREAFQLLNIKKSFFIRLFALYVLILLFSLSVLLLIWNNNINDTATTLSAANIKDVCNILNSHFADDMGTFYECMNTVAKNEVTTDFLKEPSMENALRLRAYLDDACSLASGDIKGIAVMTEENLAFGGYAYFAPDYAETDWYQTLFDSDGTNILFNRSSPSSTKISIGKRLRSRGYTPLSEYDGVIVLELESSFILDLLIIQAVNGVLRTVILDEDEHVLFSNNRVSNGEYIEDIISVSEYRTIDSVLRPVRLSGKKYMMISQELKSTPGWINITYLPQEYLYGDYEDSLIFALTCVTLIFLFAVLLSFVIICIWATKLNKLYYYIEHINLLHPEPGKAPASTESGDEIDNIHRKVNQMVDTMIGQIETISGLEKKKHNYEIQVLKAQINPHLIYNTLNVIQTLAKLQKNERIANISGSLSKLLHYSVANTDALVPLEDELQHTRSYLDIMQNKFLNDISLFMTIEEDVKECRLLKMTLQPFVENSIKHGFSDAPGNYIMIRAYRCDEDVLIKITDNGKGIPEEKLATLLTDSPAGETHLGLKNVDRRLKLTFGENYGIEVISLPNVQTTILINIPYIREEN